MEAERYFNKKKGYTKNQQKYTCMLRAAKKRHISSPTTSNNNKVGKLNIICKLKLVAIGLCCHPRFLLSVPNWSIVCRKMLLIFYRLYCIVYRFVDDLGWPDKKVKSWTLYTCFLNFLEFHSLVFFWNFYTLYFQMYGMLLHWS